MNKSFAAALALFVAAQLGYAVWFAGYRAGYDHGAAKAWDDARAALMPREELAGIADAGPLVRADAGGQ